MERTFIAVKPDGVQRGLCGEIIKRFEHRGFRLVAAKFVQVKTTPGATTHIQTTDQHILTTSRGRFFSAAVHLFIKVQLSALNWGFEPASSEQSYEAALMNSIHNNPSLPHTKPRCSRSSSMSESSSPFKAAFLISKTGFEQQVGGASMLPLWHHTDPRLEKTA